MGIRPAIASTPSDRKVQKVSVRATGHKTLGESSDIL